MIQKFFARVEYLDLTTVQTVATALAWQSFPGKIMIIEVDFKAPTLYQVLNGCVNVKRRRVKKSRFQKSHYILIMHLHLASVL